MEVTSVSVAVNEVSQVGDARRLAATAAERLGFDEETVGRVSLIATEGATNLSKHGGGGELLVTALHETRTSRAALELVVIDKGPGMRDVARCLVDGYSTAGSPGSGLGAIARISSQFDIYSAPERGTAIFSSVCGASVRLPAMPPGVLEVSGLSIPHPHEHACGDSWMFRPAPWGGVAVIADGLGHGLLAAHASRAAIETFAAMGEQVDLPASLSRLHDALRPTRGAAVAIAVIDIRAAVVKYCGVGNISGVLFSEQRDRHMVSHNGIVGQGTPRFQEFTYPWPRDGILVMHSDGLSANWQLNAYPGLTGRHPGLVAGVLYRDFRRIRDDATVLVARAAA